MFLRFFDSGLAQASFLVACDRTREAAIIDPRRDIDVYVDAAQERGLSLVSAIETHIHADFVSGARELGAIGARVVAGPGANLGYDHHEASHGERLRLGETTLEILHTPGHTPEHISVLVREPGQPVRALTGDTLFVGAVGRPDLLGADQARGLAVQLYHSLVEVLLRLSDDVEVHPGHGAGSLCGAGIGSEPHSTIRQERLVNPMLQHRTEEAFVKAVLADLPETPAYFRRMKRVNHEGPALLNLSSPVEPPRSIDVTALGRALQNGTTLLDLRTSSAFGAAHVRGAINIPYGDRLGYWAGWVVDPKAPILLIVDSDMQPAEARRQLLRVGLDRVEGMAGAEVDAWRAAGLPVTSIAQLTADELQDRLAGSAPIRVLDVRTAQEWQSGHIDGAIHIPVGEVAARVGEIPAGDVAVICEGGLRSAVVASLLERAGREAVNVADGMSAYRALEHTR